MTRSQAVDKLNALQTNDPETAHSDADEILLTLVGPDVRAAYMALSERCGWWAFA